MKEVIETVEVKKYVGNCPTCGVEQTNTWSHNVDIKCSKCLYKEDEDRKTEAIAYLESLGLKVNYYPMFGELYINSIQFDYKDHSYEIEPTNDDDCEMRLWEYKLKSD